MDDNTLSTEAILEAFAGAGRVLPGTALDQAVERWPEVGPVLLVLLDQWSDGTDRSERAREILFFAIFLMAQFRDTRAYRPLCTIAADGRQMEALIGGSIADDLVSFFTRVYDGDPAPLRRVIETAEADPFARAAAMMAIAWLTAAGRIDRSETARYLRDLFAIIEEHAGTQVWMSWLEAIAGLGLDELVPLAEEALAREVVDESLLSLSDFLADLQAAVDSDDPLAPFEDRLIDDQCYDDVVAYLSAWQFFNPDADDPDADDPDADDPDADDPDDDDLDDDLDVANLYPRIGLRSEDVRESSQPVLNPLRDVGRNDPCPCGSGKKFKKCCLVQRSNSMGMGSTWPG